MSNKKTATQAPSKVTSNQGSQPRGISIAEARRKTFEASDKMRRAQVAYADEEAERSYDYRVEE